MYIRKLDVIVIVRIKPERGAESQYRAPRHDSKQFIHVIAGDLVAIRFIDFFGMRIFGGDA